MKPFESLTHRGQLRRLRQMADKALSEYPLIVKEFKPLAHLENTTFQVEGDDGNRYVLRINRPNNRSEAEIRSEAIWLAAISEDTELTVPEPVLNKAGDLVTRAQVEGVPEERCCVLFKWVEGQFYRKRISPVALERVGRVTAKLHEHSLAFEPPAQFTRPNVQWGSEEEPGEMEQLVDKGLSEGAAIIEPQDLATFTIARHRLRSAMQEVGYDSQRFGLIHADLHHGNCLFEGDGVNVIDFDDCGWGHFVYDLAVTQWYLQGQSDFPELCAAQLEGYRQVRELPEEQAALIPTFRAARTLLMAAYMAGRSDNPKLRDMAPKFVARCAMALRDFVAEPEIS
jgi:Ser/Thr protein kinase RdoA (MazF antagonist)